MADIGDIQQTQDGQNFLMTGAGWRAISPEEAERRLAPGLDRFLRGAVGTDPGFGTAGALGRIVPFAADIAGAGGIVAAGAKGLAGAGRNAVSSFLGQGKQRAADRVRNRITGSAAAPNIAQEARTAELAMELDNPIMAFERETAERSVGAAERRTFLEEIRDEFTNPADLTPAQELAIPHAERLGFQFIPGQIQGSKLLTEGIMSNPIMRTAVESELAHNRRLLQTSAVKTVQGMGDEAVFNADTLGEMATVIGRKFDAVRDAVKAAVLPDDLVDDMAPLLSAKQRRLLNVELEGNAAHPIDGRSLMEIRSRLNGQIADHYRKGEFTLAEDVGDILDEIDDIIEASIGKSGIDAWRRARTEWRFLRVFEKPNVIDFDTGIINVRTLRNQLEKNFKGEFARQAFGPRKNLTKAQSDFMDITRVAGAFKENLGDSGTAGRTLASQLLTNPKQAGKAFIARRFIQAEADRLNR